MFKRSDFRISQEKSSEFAIIKKKCALFLGMGMGKTATGLTVAKYFLDDFLVSKVLIIGPKRVANTVWKQEAQNWEHLKDLNIRICTGSNSDRSLAITSKAEIHVINRENIDWLIKKAKWKYDMIIIDESTSFKNSKSKRWRALKSVTKYCKSIILLTGTPAPGGEIDLWAQCYLIDNGERLGKNITMFRQRFFDADYMGYSYKIKEGASDKIKQLISDICLYLDPKDHLDLPDAIPLTYYAELPDNVRKQYNELEKELLLTVNNIDIMSASNAAMRNKLSQICNGAIYDSEKVAHELHDEKIQILKDIIEDNPGENFLVAYNFKSDLSRLQKAFPKAKILDDSIKVQKDWNEGKIKILLAHPASAGHGLNLQFGGSIIVWFGLNWSLELYQQFNKRIDRPGQKNIVRICHIVARDTVDEDIMLSLTKKDKTQQSILDFLKMRLKIV